MAICPSCGAKSTNVVKSFDVQAEPEDGEEAKYLSVSILQCERCGFEFPTFPRRRRYKLVAKSEFERVLDETAKLKEENNELEKEVDSAKAKNERLKRSMIEIEQMGTIQLLEERLIALEDEVLYLRVEKEELERVINFITKY